MLTGVRRNEALGLTWDDIYDGKIHFTKVKNKKAHFVPLVGVLKDLLGERPTESTEHRSDVTSGKKVFGYTDASLRTAFDKFKKQVQFNEDWSIHDLRRTFSEHMNLIGYSELDIAVANNQASTTVTGRHYLGGQLAKESLLRRMHEDLQRQFEYYYRDNGGDVQKVPDGWMPADMLDDQEITEEEWLEYSRVAPR